MENKLREYAKLVVEVGTNIDRGQTLVLSSPVDCAPFARLCAEAAYAAGCREVVMNWTDDFMTRRRYLHAADEVFDIFPDWRAAFYEDLSAEGAAFLRISSSDPENLLGVDPDRIKRSDIAAGAKTAAYRRRQMANEFAWCIASVPSVAWAKKVFPNAVDSMEKLWDAILQSVRVSGDGSAVRRWREHIDRLTARKTALNALRLKSLHYQNALGTDLWVELPETHFWEAGSERSTAGREFVANMPTEEVFTAPKRDGVNGTVVTSMPLVLSGNIIERFKLELKDGKIVRVEASQHEDLLKNAISVDEGAAYLGEAALVPHSSPIGRTGILFYNTLFDENASCHFAFGEAYPCIEGGATMSKEELRARGLNDSITHVDFMVGTPDLSITGRTADGQEVPIFIGGEFSV